MNKLKVATKSLYILFALIVTACSDYNNSIDTEEAQKDTKKEITLSRAEKEIIANQTEFGLNLLKEINSTNAEKAFVISPYSLSSALSIIANGVTETAQKELINVLAGENVSINEINVLHSKIITEFPGLDSKVTFVSANCFCSPINNFCPTLLEVGDKYYKTKYLQAEFTTDEGINIINHWAKQNTNGIIEKFLDNPILAEWGIINASYFKGQFTDKFDKSKTKELDFTSIDNDTHKVPTMCGERYLKLFTDEDMTMVQIPFGNGSFRLNIILPGGIENEFYKTLPNLLDYLTINNWNNAQSNLRSIKAKLFMPKFKISYKENMIDALKNIGIHTIFDSHRYNSGILTSIEPVSIKFTPMATFISVDEEGAEAAAVSGVMGGMLSDDPITLHINRPFAFIIDEESTGTILYAGAVRDI